MWIFLLVVLNLLRSSTTVACPPEGQETIKILANTRFRENFSVVKIFNKKTQKTLYITGEAHHKDKEDQKIGAAWVDLFKLRLLENVPGLEYRKSSVTEDIESTIVNLARILKNRATDFSTSNIDYAFKHGISLHNYGVIKINDKIIEKLYLEDDSPFKCDALRVEHKTPYFTQSALSELKNVINSIVSKKSLQTLPLNISLETHGYLDPYEGNTEITRIKTYNYQIIQRNSRMVRGILESLRVFNEHEKGIVLVGQNHVSGIVELLKKEGWEKCPITNTPSP